MKLTRLRIVGFKSFVEPAEVVIEPGLTGVIGPNGCGKSNLVEALRWVMGESSYKNMRASGMDDVIFSGSGNRPPRNTAEVVLTIDNARRTAPAAFNDSDTLEVSRKIEREAGSTYRVNGREVRARDVQLLFADAATGARSPALVRQGQVSEMIAAKPQARRRILEDAAGIAGLHARRHEAELRLKAADDNLLRVEDVLSEIRGQVESLQRQGRQASRFRALSAEIRKLEALLHLIAHREAREAASAAERRAEETLGAVADAQREQTAAATAQAVAAHALPALREAEAAAAAELQRHQLARAELEAAERRAKERLAELERHLAEIERDLVRERAQIEDARASRARLAEEAASLADGGEGSQQMKATAEARAKAAEAALARVEATAAALQAEVSDRAARGAALDRAAREETERTARFAGERARIERELAGMKPSAGGASLEALRAEAASLEEAARAAEDAATAARETLARTRAAEQRARGPLAEAERNAQRLETEARTLSKLFAPAGERFSRILDEVEVEKGFEAALAAALGEDLEASTAEAAPVRWAMSGPSESDPPLPEGARALAEVVRGPPALARRLRQIGLVARADGTALQAPLAPGQRLVSREGDLWRWDGFKAAAEAPSAAARRLAERNRLGDIERAAQDARSAVARLKTNADTAQAALRAAASEEAARLESARQTRRALDGAREKLAAAERRETEGAARRAALQEAQSRVAASEIEAQVRLQSANAARRELAIGPELEAELAGARNAATKAQAEAADARAALQALLREADLRTKRRAAVSAEIELWTTRVARAEKAASELAAREERTRAERDALREAPDTFLVRRRALLGEIAAAEAARHAAADHLLAGEAALTAADRAARAALEALAAAREARAGAQARAEAALQRVGEISRAIRDALDTTPDGLFEIAGIAPGAALPEAAGAEARLATLRSDRDRLGAVNLRAGDELLELEAKRDGLAGERDDLVEAIKRLRHAIATLNREGRERLLSAFGTVNGHFQHLFTTLFGGGTAELTLVDADDPLEAGLEILARPPGKKPQTMTLLSGGEQALTAIALIFAVFLTNPSPVCVLDEVDAPLDDANVERYCTLLRQMAGETETRFIVITHNPITMARMNRLFGVTMAERGVSQLVSVDLDGAERLREAG